MKFVNGFYEIKNSPRTAPKHLQEALRLIKSESLEDANEECINHINNKQKELFSTYHEQHIADFQRKLLELEKRNHLGLKIPQKAPN